MPLMREKSISEEKGEKKKPNTLQDKDVSELDVRKK